jgi:hypothetical protein
MEINRNNKLQISTLFEQNTNYYKKIPKVGETATIIEPQFPTEVLLHGM